MHRNKNGGFCRLFYWLTSALCYMLGAMKFSSIQLHARALRRPYWLLLALALFLGGQIASAGHWHDNAKTVDSECALCVLSSATSGAITANAWQATVVSAFIFFAIYFVVPFTRETLRVYNSRAPPHRF